MTVALVLAWVLVGAGDAAPASLRAAVGAATALFVPGYAVVAALFPRDGRSSAGDAGRGPTRPSTVERLLFAVAASLGATVLVVVVLQVLPPRLGAVPVLGGLTAVTLVGVGVAALRRPGSTVQAVAGVGRPADAGTLPAAIRSRVAGQVRPPGRLNAALLVVAVLGGAVAGVLVLGSHAPAYTEFYVLADDAGASANASTLADGVGDRTHRVRVINHEVTPSGTRSSRSPSVPGSGTAPWKYWPVR